MDTSKKYGRLKIADGKHLVVDKHRVVCGYPWHWHSYFELEIILSGEGEYIINDVKYDISKYNVFFLTPTDYHYITSAKTTELINISFDEEIINEKELIPIVLSQTKKAYAFSKYEYENLVKATELLQYELSMGGNYQKHLLQYVLTCILRKNQITYTDMLCNEPRQGINKAIVYMQMHFKEKITLQILADEAGYNPTYFSELFKKVTGENYITFLNKLRVSYARALLANGISVSQACFLSGFGSLSNFGVIFKKNCRMSPYEYVKASRK